MKGVILDLESIKIVIPAVIGAFVAIIVFILKDIILYWYRTNKQRKMDILDRKLAELYGPLFIAMYAGEGMIGNIFSDNATYEKLITNMHLLSPKLFILIKEYLVEFNYKTGQIDMQN